MEDQMSLPTLTPEQRTQALEKAAQVRQLRAKLKADMTASFSIPSSGFALLLRAILCYPAL